MNDAELLKINDDPLMFSELVLGIKLWDKQAAIIRSIRDNPRTTVRSCHGIGKTFLAATAILWFLFAHLRSIVLSTAPTWRQVVKLIWKEIRTAYANAKYSLGGNLLPKSPELQIIQDQWYAAGLSTDTPDRFQGFHEEHIFVVADEAAGISEDIFEAIEGVLTSKGARLLLLGNPTAIGGTFYKAFKDPAYAKFHISAFDTPNFTSFGITQEDIATGAWEEKIGNTDIPYPKLITPSWVAGRFQSWGETSIAYQARVMGNFPEQGDDTLIPLSWIEASMERWHEMEDSLPVEIGVDVARYGTDNTVIAVRHGNKADCLKVYSQKPLMETVGLVKITAEIEGTDKIKVDEIGSGGGVVDRLAELGYDNTGVNVAEKALEPERFKNLRTELWWNLRERLDPDIRINPNPIGLPPDDELLMELSAVKYKINSRGQFQLEGKDEMKKRLGRSPDRADAVVLAFAPGQPEGFVIAGGKTLTSEIFRKEAISLW